MERGFVLLKDAAPEILVELRYATNNNFLGRTVAGYTSNNAVCTEIAAQALKAANNAFNEHGYGIKVFDSYRPQKAVDDFWNWACDTSDTKMKNMYYPTYDDKTKLFEDGFIARYSAHSRGSTFDITLVSLESGEEIDMGSIFDFFGPISFINAECISDEAKQNRMLLQDIMKKSGFSGYSKEWWHFNLNNEPYPRKPEDHFNFDV